MKHPIYKVRSVKIVAPYALQVGFDDGTDFDPATLHDWPQFATALAARAREWDSQPA